MSKKINVREVKDAEFVPAENDENIEAVEPAPADEEVKTGKTVKILGRKVTIEKEEKVKKEKKEKPPREKPSKAKVIAGIGGGLLVAGAVAKGVLGFIANRSIDGSDCAEDYGYPPEDTAEGSVSNIYSDEPADVPNVDQA